MASWAATSPGRRRCATSSARFASGFIFTTALPPAVAAAATASIRHLKEADVERHAAAARWRGCARGSTRGIPHCRNPSHIIPVMVKDPVKCRISPIS
jgi:5-aminolevulinate synthase